MRAPRTGAPRVALVTCAELPEADPDTRRVIPQLAAHGIDATPAVWSDAAIDWSAFDLAIVRSCWDYAARRTEFLAWASRVPRLANAAEVLAWNTDKRYLAALAGAGIPIVPTTWVRPGDAWAPPRARDDAQKCVVKPAVSLCALDTGRYDLATDADRALAVQHVWRLQSAGRLAMIQPYLASVDTAGETSLVFMDGAYSHAVRKAAALAGPDRGEDRRFVPNGGLDVVPRDPTPAERALAERVLALVPGGAERLLYARVDLVSGQTGDPRLMEVELTEPQLYLAHSPGAADRLAAAILRRILR
jgi:hypothetical protein